MTSDPRAAADPVTPEAINREFSPRLVGRRIVFFESIDSTNRRLHQAATQGAEEGTVFIAETQTAGRGRLNRIWASPPGVGIYISLLLRPRLPATKVYLYTFLPAVAAARALRNVSGLPVFIHWPNDIMLRGQKLAGILTETRSLGGQVHEVIVGAGINVNHTAADLPEELRETATSLAMASGRTFPRAAVVRAFLGELDRGYAALTEGRETAILEEWRRLSPSQFGTPVVVAGGSAGSIPGTTRGVDEDGALLVEREDGGMERVSFGEVRRVKGG